MNKLICFLSLLISCFSIAQSFPPEYGEPGSTAIPKDSSCFVAWADNGEIYRGYIDINDTTIYYQGSNRATFGELSYAFGQAEGTATNVVSLGDSGYITLTFPQIIFDGAGVDFAVFENSFADHYMELGHVEVSSDGIHFFRFPSISEIPLVFQVDNFSSTDCRFVNNLAGKYKVGFGTPFDLSDLADDSLLDKNSITHVRIVDAIGAITGIGSTDQFGTTINEPYPTPFASGGFDLDGIGIINGFVGLEELSLEPTIYPNPTEDAFTIRLLGNHTIMLYSITGQEIYTGTFLNEGTISFDALDVEEGIYFVKIGDGTNGVKRLVYTK